MPGAAARRHARQPERSSRDGPTARVLRPGRAPSAQQSRTECVGRSLPAGTTAPSGTNRARTSHPSPTLPGRSRQPAPAWQSRAAPEAPDPRRSGRARTEARPVLPGFRQGPSFGGAPLLLPRRRAALRPHPARQATSRRRRPPRRTRRGARRRLGGRVAPAPRLLQPRGRSRRRPARSPFWPPQRRSRDRRRAPHSPWPR